MEKRLRDAGAPVHILNKPKGFFPFAIAKVYDFLRLTKTDILHVHDLSTQGYALPAALLAGVSKRITSYHSVAQTLSPGQLRIARLTAKGYDIIHTVGDNVSESLQKAGFSSDKLLCIKNGIVLDDFPMTDEQTRKQAKGKLGIADLPVVGAVGRFVPKKNFDRVIRAIGELHKKGRKVFLLIAGDGPLKEKLQSLAESQCDPALYRFLPPTSDVLDLYRAMDILALPSVDEGIPQVVLEAMATGACVVAGKNTQSAEIIEDQKEGILLPNSNEEQLVTAIESLLLNDNRRREIRIAAREKVERSFSFEFTNREYLKMYRELLGFSNEL